MLLGFYSPLNHPIDLTLVSRVSASVSPIFRLAGQGISEREKKLDLIQGTGEPEIEFQGG
jgi:hypothetical protein